MKQNSENGRTGPSLLERSSVRLSELKCCKSRKVRLWFA